MMADLSAGLLFFSFLERDREQERETSKCGCLLSAPYWRPDLACNPGMCPDWELNRGPPLDCRLVLNPLSHTSQGKCRASNYLW